MTLRYWVDGKLTRRFRVPTYRTANQQLDLIAADWSRGLGMKGPNNAVSIDRYNEPACLIIKTTDDHTLMWD